MNENEYAGAFETPGLMPPRIWEYVLAGLLLAGCTGAVLGYYAYHGFVTEEIALDKAYWGIGLPFVGVALGVYIFSYGWQRGDIDKAVRMSMFLTLGVLGIVAAVVGTLALKRSIRTGGLRLPGFGYATRRRRSGWHFGGDDDDYDEYNDPRPIFARASHQQAGGIEIHCTKCGELFLPQAPGAYCPRCGHSAIGRPPVAQERRSRRRA